MSRPVLRCFARLLVAGLLALSFTMALGQKPTACGVHSDFMVRSDPLLAPVRPEDCASLTQTPPEFTWPPQDGANTYALALTFPDGHTETRNTSKNWLLWDKAIPAGSYTWRVKVSGANTEQGEARRFAIAPNPVAFVVPGPEEALKTARGTPRPRSWPQGAGNPVAAMKTERAPGFALLLQKVDGELRKDVAKEPGSLSRDANYDETVAEQKRTLDAALAWAATKNPRYGADAARRLLAQAGWSKSGALSYTVNDMASRTVAWTLALGYDWTYDYLEASQRATIVAAIRARTQPMFDDIVGKISAAPYDSHGNLTLTIVAAIGVLMAGDLMEADRWVREALPMAVVWTSPWGGPDGGFANGTAQMFWDTASNLTAWYVFRNAAGVDVAKKEWTRNHARFMAYFVPPLAPAGNFGDGQELHIPELWARTSKALASFAPSPMARWYAAQQNGEDPARMELLLAPRPEKGAAPLPAGTPNAALFPSVGWVAMHSNLADPARTSIYFKASPYGSYNHSHGDQNTFVVNHKGKRLAIASGYYDGYRTPHWNLWYKQTKSANGITFDWGQGQGINGKQFSGEITRFETSAIYDYAVGHAGKAYAGQLTQAQRTLVYLRPNTVIIHDIVTATRARSWEWNIHALNRIDKLNDNRIRIVSDGAQMCVEMLSGPEVAFVQTDKFAAPPTATPAANQWHGVFMSTAKSPSAEFVVLMRIGSDCPAPVAGEKVSAAARRNGDAWQVSVDGKTVTLAGESVSVK